MKYEKAQNLLPENIIELIQEYIDGGYLYIPRKTNNRKSWGEGTETKKDLKERNIEILKRYDEGVSAKELTKNYFLTENSIRRIIRQEKKVV
ncbi:hypothetical protein CHL78_007215 [Romboutsia weinsteinii]|uniref:Mor transcription activator domain-containing protein n=1 Tax=Romboutsia weinsteinii TaxID=2020949 RepID=A0A371J5T5_9FIRM|nr:CD3324 family protein [Romboutsia weinsteinii]RDY28084.1 hypothetical protein CHL78_007215 [Romboutsia weinsteinii]